MPAKIFAMDTWFYNSTGHYSFETRAEMLKDLGYDGMYYLFWCDWQSTWDDFSKLATVREKFGLEVAAVYQVLDLSLPESHPSNRKVVDTLERMEGCTTLDLALTGTGCEWKPSDPLHDSAALRALERLLKIADRRGITIALYPHLTFWLEKSDDELRLISALPHPKLRLNFCGMHWFSVDNCPVYPLLERLHPHLHGVNLNGSRKPNPAGLPATIEPIDEGEMDNFAIVRKLHQLGFDGWYGFQGYSAGNDVYAKLRRSLAAFREFEVRINRFPNWEFRMNPPVPQP